MILRVWYCCAPSLYLFLFTAGFSRWTLKGRVWSYGVGYCCAPSRPRDAGVFARFDEVIEGIILRGLVLLCPLPIV